MSGTTVADYLHAQGEQAEAANPAAAETWFKLESFYNRRLWHQMTLVLVDFVKNDFFSNGSGLVALYENVVRDIEDRIDPLSLVRIINAVFTQIEDPAACIAFVEPIQKKVQSDVMATVSLNTMIALQHTELKDLDKAKEVLKDCESSLDAMVGVTPVHAAYYKAASSLHKIEGSHANFYADALKYLGCVDMDTMEDKEAVALAYDLGIAALLGDGIYNIGELLSHRVVDALRGAAEHAWLVELLDAFNAGNVGKFSDLRPTWSAKCPALAGHADALLLKVRLLAVMEQVFQRQAKDRTIAFGDLATAANVAEDEVEVLVMKALSLGLVKGTLDQIDQVVAFTWVQPRVLDKTQLQDMHVRLGDWLTKVESATQLMSQTAPELLVGH
eukprot:m.880527 g.880527  ORF g.880527 m.880527 type:complete len:387 (-) comp23591_c2_seq4:2713-3873(-)